MKSWPVIQESFCKPGLLVLVNCLYKVKMILNGSNTVLNAGPINTAIKIFSI